MSQTFNSFLGTGWAFAPPLLVFSPTTTGKRITGIVFFSQYRMISSGQ